MKAWATVSAAMFTIRMAPSHLANLSIQISKLTYPLETGRGPTMSIHILANLASGVLNLLSGAVV